MPFRSQQSGFFRPSCQQPGHSATGQQGCNFPQPTTARQLREFVGLINFYHRFIPHAAQILQPLNALIPAKHHPQQLVWTDEATTAFTASKEALAQATLLSHPKLSAPTCIVTDASDVAVGAVLQQVIEGVWCPISFFSKKLKPPETRYSAFDRELRAVYLATKHFRHFIEGRDFHIRTDHKPIIICIGCSCRPPFTTTNSSP